MCRASPSSSFARRPSIHVTQLQLWAQGAASLAIPARMFKSQPFAFTFTFNYIRTQMEVICFFLTAWTPQAENRLTEQNVLYPSAGARISTSFVRVGSQRCSLGLWFWPNTRPAGAVKLNLARWGVLNYSCRFLSVAQGNPTRNTVLDGDYLNVMWKRRLYSSV